MKLKLLGLVLALSIGCADSPTGPSKGVALTIDFSRGPLGFIADFADYPPADAPIYALTADYRPLPPPLDQSKSALFISGINRSDDLFMFYRRQVGGLQPNQRYRATFEVSFATTARVGCVGVGGSEDSVWIKAGATTVEPTPVLRAGYLRMNVDIGSQANWGANAMVLGTVAGTRPCEQEPAWEARSLNSRTQSVPVEAGADGRVWLLFGSDSGFESLTALYYTRLAVTFEPI